MLKLEKLTLIKCRRRELLRTFNTQVAGSNLACHKMAVAQSVEQDGLSLLVALRYVCFSFYNNMNNI